MTDQELVVATTAGDMESFRLLMERYQRPLLKYAQLMTGDLETARAIVGYCFIRAYQNLRGYEPKRSFANWLYAIAHTVIFKNSPAQADTPLGAAAVSTKASHGATANSLQGLSPSMREPLVLLHVAARSEQDLSEILCLPIPTVQKLLRTAKQAVHGGPEGKAL